MGKTAGTMGNRMTRHIDKHHFLTRHGFGDWPIIQIAGDASFRTYDRISQDDQTHVVMDAPPPHEDVRPFIALTNHLTTLGYAAPRLLAHDIEKGFLLLEDLGDDRYSRILAHDPAQELSLYEAAIDLLIDMQQKPAPANIAIDGTAFYTLPTYNKAVLNREILLLTDWYMPAIGLDSDERQSAVLESFSPLFDAVSAANSTLILRDYHADNLMWLPQRASHQRVGLLDYQDALFGNPAYDLVSLLEDARRDVSPQLEHAMITRFLDGSPHLDREAFLAHYHILGAGRNAKIIGIFTRLYKRDGKAAYLNLIPRVWALLERNLNHPALATAKAVIDQLIPPAKRTIPARETT